MSKELDPDFARMLRAMADMDVPSLFTGDPVLARATIRTTSVEMRDDATLPAIAPIEDATVDRPDGSGSVGVRVYGERGSGRPTVVFLHGGGWMVGDLDTHDDAARRLAVGWDAVVVSVDYRLAPEHPFPAAFDDAKVVTEAVLAAPDRFGGGPVSLAGDSAGANLAAAVAVERAGAGLSALVLFYPATDLATVDRPSATENAEGFFLTAVDAEAALRRYVGDFPDVRDPRLSPIFSPHLASLPPTVVAVAGFDPLRDDGRAFAAAVSEAGVPCRLLGFDALIHGFLSFAATNRAANAAVDEVVDAADAWVHTPAGVART